MRIFKNFIVVLLALGLTLGLSPSLRAEEGKSEAAPADAAKAAAPAPAPALAPAEVASRMQELQDEVDRLQGEMAKLKEQLGGMSTTGASSAAKPQAAQAETVPAAATAPAAQAAAVAPTTPATPEATSLATVLGPINVTGFVDGYYNYNLNQPHSRITSFRPFDGTDNQFSLNMVELTINKAPDAANSRLGYDLTFGFGNAMNAVNSASPGDVGFAQYLKEAYISYLAPVGKGLQIDFGKFVTPAGAEVIETKDDWNYSRGLLFSYAIPYYHFGLRAKYTFNDKFSLTGYAVNGWNDIIDNNTGKTYGASIGWTPNKKWGVTENYLAGPEEFQNNSNWRQLSDTVITYNPTSKLSLMANYDYAQGDKNPIPTDPRSAMWTGVAGYVRYAFNERYAVAVRGEYFDDRDGFATALTPVVPQHFNEGTFTFERIVGKHLISRWEYRRDMSNRPTFAKGGGYTDHQDTFTGGLVYVFDVKEH